MFDSPTAEQRLVLDLVAEIYLTRGDWPAWAWLEEELERQGHNGMAVYRSFGREFSVGYSQVWPRRDPSPSPQDRVGLTLAGLAHVQLAIPLVQATLNLISALGTCRENVRLDPFAVERPKIPRSTILQGRVDSSLYGAMVVQLLQKEPAAWHCQFNPPTEGWQEVELSPEIRRFAGVQSVDDYLQRLRLTLGNQEEPAVTFHSPFTLPAAIDYLDAVWRLRFANHLVSPPGVERSARLAFTATSAEEADSRFSALAELLKGLNVPGVEGIGGHPLARLGPFLESKLPDESHDRIREAVALLDAARQVRAGAQHAGARSKSIDAFTLLGLGFPVYDWPAAWEHVQVVAATAFDSIRDEIQAAPTEEP
jgi:hypothetical protein